MSCATIEVPVAPTGNELEFTLAGMPRPGFPRLDLSYSYNGTVVEGARVREIHGNEAFEGDDRIEDPDDDGCVVIQRAGEYLLQVRTEWLEAALLSIAFDAAKPRHVSFKRKLVERHRR